MSIYEEAQKDRRTTVAPTSSRIDITPPPINGASLYEQAQADRVNKKSLITPTTPAPLRPAGTIGGKSLGTISPLFAEQPTFLDKAVTGVKRFFGEVKERIETGLTIKPEDYDQTAVGKLLKTNKTFVGGIVSGFTGGIIKPETETPKDLKDKVISGIGQAVGTVSAISYISKGLNAIASGSKTIQVVTAAYPKVSKYVYPFIQNAIAFDVYGQLDPLVESRLGKLAEDTLISVPYTALGFLPKARVSIPAAVTLGFGLAKLDGASNEDAFIAGAILGALDAVGRIGGENTHFVTGRRSDVILKSEASNVINEFSTTKITSKSSPEIIKKAYREAAHATHPDLNPGQDANFRRVNSAYQFLTGKSATLDLRDLSVKEQPVTKDTYQQAQQDKKLPTPIIPTEKPKIVPEKPITPALEPLAQEARKLSEAEFVSKNIFDRSVVGTERKAIESFPGENFSDKLSAFYRQARGEITPTAKAISKELEPLAVEARKYKSAEEFEKAMTGENILSPDLNRAMETLPYRKQYKDLTDFYNQAMKGITPEVIPAPKPEKIVKAPEEEFIKGEVLTIVSKKTGEKQEVKFRATHPEGIIAEESKFGIPVLMRRDLFTFEKKPVEIPKEEKPKEEAPPTKPLAKKPLVKKPEEAKAIQKAGPVADIISKIIPKRPHLPILGEFRVKDGTLTATDLEVGVRIKTDLPDGMYKLVGKDAVRTETDLGDFPEIPEVKGEVSFKVLPDQLSKTLKSATLAINKNISKEALKGVYMKVEENKVLVVSTDSFRMYIKEMPAKIREKGTFILSNPDKVQKVIDRLEGALSITIGKENIKISNEDGEVIIRKIDVDFPEFEQIIPSFKKRYSFDREEALKALKELVPYTSETDKAISLIFEDNKISLSAKGKQVSINMSVKNVNTAKEVINDGVLTIGIVGAPDLQFNIDYITDALKSLEGDLTYFYTTDTPKTNPAFFSDKEISSKEVGKPDKISESSTIKASIGGFKEDVPIELGHLQEIRPIEFPELVDMARELMGQVPRVLPKEKLRAMGGLARGLFIPAGKGKIKLAADLFKPENLNQLARTLAHEIGHLIDYLPEQTMKRGNILGRLFTLKSFLKSTFGTETGGLTAQDFREIRNRVTKETLAKHDIPFGDWITGKVDIKLRKSINKEIQQIYSQEVKTVISERGLVSKKEIFNELMEVSKYWRPILEGSGEKYLKYRNKPEELYADAISVLFNSPGTLERMAPKFYKEFFENLDKKPEVKDSYFELQAIMSQDRAAITSYRRKGVRQMFDSGDYKAKELEELRLKEKTEKQRSLSFLLKFELASRNAEIENKISELKAKGVSIPDDENPLYYLREGNYIGGKMKAIIETKFQTIYDNLNKNGISWIDFGEVLFYERIIGGDRSDKANPRGLTPEAVRENYDALKAQLGADKFELLQISAQEFRTAIKEINTAAYESGLYSTELFNEMQANPAYASFKVIEHMEAGDTFKVFKQIGTLKDIVNPADATILKALAVVRATERNNTAKSVIKFLKEFYPTEIAPAEKRFTGKAMQIIEPKSEFQKLATYYEGGKLQGSYVDPYVAEALQRSTIGQNLAVIRAFRFMNGRLFRPLFITFNLGFQGFNLIRDFRRFYKVIPDMTLWRALNRYTEAARPAKIRAFGLPKNPSPADLEAQKLIQSMEMDKVLSITFNDLISYRDVEEKQFEQILKKYKVTEGITEPTDQTKFEKFLTTAGKPFMPILNFIERLGNLIETLPKVAGHYELRGKVPPREMRDFIRRNIGSPDFLDRGYITPLTNEVFLFSNAIIQGIRSDLEIATGPKTRSGYWWKTFKVDFLPTILKFAALAGLFGEKLKKMMEDVSEYDKTNYTIIPLGTNEKGKTIYARIPHDETGRFLSGILWKTLRIFSNEKSMYSDLTDILSYTGGQLPSVSPVVGGIVGTTQFLAGSNPYDFFRGRTVLTDDELKAGGWDATAPFLKWQFNQLGGGIFMKLYHGEVSPREKTPGEQVLALPLISNVLGRFVKISDYGQTEKLRSQLTPVQQEQARERIRERQILNDYVEQYQKDKKAGIDTVAELQPKLVEEIIGHPPATKDEAEHRNRIIKKFKIGIIKGAADPRINALIEARTTEEEIELIKEFKTTMTDKEFSELRELVVLNKITSGAAFIKALNQ